VETALGLDRRFDGSVSTSNNLEEAGAGEGIRTLDPDLGNPVVLRASAAVRLVALHGLAAHLPPTLPEKLPDKNLLLVDWHQSTFGSTRAPSRAIRNSPFSSPKYVEQPKVVSPCASIVARTIKKGGVILFQ
jgi:hypothetical protein